MEITLPAFSSELASLSSCRLGLYLLITTQNWLPSGHLAGQQVSEIFFTIFNEIFSDTDGRGGPGWPLQSVLVPEEHWKQDSSVR